MELLLIGILTLAAATLFFHSILFSAMRRQETAARLGLRARKQVEGAALFNLFQPLLPGLSRRLKKLSWNSYRHWTERKLIIAGYKGMNQDWNRLKKAYSWLTEEQLRAALNYYSCYPDEIESRIEADAAIAPETLYERYPFMRPPHEVLSRRRSQSNNRGNPPKRGIRRG